MLVREGDRMTNGLDPTDSCLHDWDQDAKHEKNEENTCKLLLQRHLMHHIVIGLQDYIEGLLLKVSVVE